ncbi:MAG: pyrroline-5-carboxylate reductase [Firmicutes bacterium]|nr:pyrroline-5-carboxylate reductase [Bacillota bacterium]
MKIGFIGAGNMGGALLKGYAPAAQKKGDVIFVYDQKEAIRSSLEKSFPAVAACGSQQELAEQSDILVLGVKPNVFAELLPQIAEHVKQGSIIVSMAAGIRISFIEGFLGADKKIIRIMPNLPAQVGEAMIAACRNNNVSDEAFKSVFQILEAVGKAEEVTEDLIHCVIGVSGSSPAYTYMYIDALIQAAVDNGMEEDKAKIFAAQSVLGAAKMVLENDISVEQLRINVCSPGGTTIEAVNTLFENGFQDNVKAGFQAAVDKSKLMSK